MTCETMPGRLYIVVSLKFGLCVMAKTLFVMPVISLLKFSFASANMHLFNGAIVQVTGLEYQISDLLTETDGTRDATTA